LSNKKKGASAVPADHQPEESTYFIDAENVGEMARL